GLFVEEFPDSVRAAVENDVDVFVARLPWIFENLAAFLLETCCGRIAQPVHGLAQRHAPFLVPIWIPAGVAAAVARPALDSVRATPCGTFPDLSFVLRRVPLEIFAVVGQFREIIA